ncbi:transmembrane protein 265 [Rana temporaria]|uniref:transmembrane protein 265 n=1 Tax=Rana temporaria TaxID=8407 RepID=UPI001AACCBE8|nr:transmembrane protein 265 [Rana temporaria]
MSSNIKSPTDGKSHTLEMKELPNPAGGKIQNGSPEETRILINQNQRWSSPPCRLRRLAIMSIVCGISCVGIKALLLALRAEREVGVKNYEVLARRSRRFAVLSIALFVGGLVLLPVLVVLVSYIMTLIE